MSKSHDTYEAALTAVAAALDALADTAANRASAHDPRADDYDPLRHHVAAGRSHGAHDALAVVTGMLADYRKAGAA